MRTRGFDAGQVYRVGGAQYLLGRHPKCDISDVFADDQTVSREHARLVNSAGRVVLEDLNSRKGTKLNGERLTAPSPLHDGDLIEIGSVEFTFYHADPSRALMQRIEWEPLPDVQLEEQPSAVQRSVSLSLAMDSAGQRANCERRLQAVLTLQQTLGRATSIDCAVDDLLAGMLALFPVADRALIGSVDEGGDMLVPRAVRFRNGSATEKIQLSRTIIRRAMDSVEAVLSNDAQSDARFGASDSLAASNIRSLICAPLVTDAGHRGFIQLDTAGSQATFQDEDLEVLACLVPQASLALSFSQWHRDAMRRQAMERDLELARTLQLGLLPDAPPDVEGYTFFDHYQSAHDVCGDYYDYVRLPGNRLAVIVGDASGKGVSAALLMAKAAGELKYLLSIAATPEQAFALLNERLCKGQLRGQFITLLAIVVDLDRHLVTVVNAGHSAPLLRRGDGQVEDVAADARGMALGVDDSQGYVGHQLQLINGESLCLFSDGFAEAKNSQDQIYGAARVRAQLAEPCEDIKVLGSRLLQDVERFVDHRPPCDDMCLLCFGRQ